MAVVRTHHYSIDPADLGEFLTRRAALIAAVRAAYPGLAEARLTRMEDGSYRESWRWDTAAQMQAGLPATALSEARVALALPATTPPTTARSSMSGNRASSLWPAGHPRQHRVANAAAAHPAPFGSLARWVSGRQMRNMCAIMAGRVDSFAMR